MIKGGIKLAIFKCRTCGGNLVVKDGEKLCTCEYCGVEQTVPTADDGKKINLFNRVSELIRTCDFSRAAVVYENIISEYPNEAEAYWGLCLCEYGIEYVDDAKTRRKIPTCHRTSLESIFYNRNYIKAMELADAVSAEHHRAEAEEIEQIQQRILQIARSEEPFDIFICYKETDEHGGRTQDSVLAQEIYDKLTSKGYKVFFARITLENTLGQEYEPHIFAALNSAKIMLAIGTKPEYYEAVWVKNEWSRFLSLMQKGDNKVLIPCYRNMDPYKMPPEFKNLQAQDMMKVGYMQDLMRGIEKILPRGTAAVDSGAGGAQREATVFLKRAFLSLEDGDWEKADLFSEQVLNLDPECARAYLIKLLAELRIRREEELVRCSRDFDCMNNYRKCYQFADNQYKQRLDFYARERVYNIAGDYYSKKNYKKAADTYSGISDFKDSSTKEKECCYIQADNAFKSGNYKEAEFFFKRAGNYYDSAQRAADAVAALQKENYDAEQTRICRSKLEAIKNVYTNMNADDDIVFAELDDIKKRYNRIYVGGHHVVTYVVCGILFVISIISLFVHDMVEESVSDMFDSFNFSYLTTTFILTVFLLAVVFAFILFFGLLDSCGGIIGSLIATSIIIAIGATVLLFALKFIDYAVFGFIKNGIMGGHSSIVFEFILFITVLAAIVIIPLLTRGIRLAKKVHMQYSYNNALTEVEKKAAMDVQELANTYGAYFNAEAASNEVVAIVASHRLEYPS